MNLKLSDKHLYKLSTITGIQLPDLVSLDAMGILDTARCLQFLVKYDWKILSKTKRYTADQKIQALCNEYNYSASHMRELVYKHNRIAYYCKDCGHEISKLISKQNDGLCDKCVVKSIKL
jgi:hypothetical protein